jgi:Uma2 family endonuclease
MSTIRSSPEIEYPDSDGQPLAETPQHRDNLLGLIEMLRIWFAQDDNVYISGNMFVYYVPGNRLRHLAPDVFVVRGIPKHTTPERRRYLTWEEGKAPDFIVEFTSPSTREEDLDDKFVIYQDQLKVQEYFLFDPFEEYLEPPMRGYRLVGGRYVPIEEVDGRLPSEVLGLHLERRGEQLRLYDPATRQIVLMPIEIAEQAQAARAAAEARAEAERALAEEARQRAEAANAAQQRAEKELEQIRRELDALRRQTGQA